MAKTDKVIAIDFGGTFIKSAVVDRDGNVLKKEKTPTESDKNTETVISNIYKAVEKVYSEDILGIGIGIPGCVNTTTGETNWIANIPCLNGVSVTDAIRKKYDLPMAIDNDATLAGVGEYFYGAGKGAKYMLCVTLGTGVGGGFVFDGKVHHGVIDYAGEIGHITYVPNGLQCTCGKRGCLEAYASATAIINRAKSVIKRGIIESRLHEFQVKDIDAKLVYDLSKEDDPACKYIVREVGKALGVVLGSIMNMLNLDRIVIGGGVASAGDVLFRRVRRFASHHALPYAFKHCEIVPAKLGNDAGTIGAAASVFNKIKSKS